MRSSISLRQIGFVSSNVYSDIHRPLIYIKHQLLLPKETGHNLQEISQYMGFLMFGLEIMVNHWRYETMIQNAPDFHLQEDFSFLQNLQQKFGSKARGPVVQVIDYDQLWRVIWNYPAWFVLLLDFYLFFILCLSFFSLIDMPVSWSWSTLEPVGDENKMKLPCLVCTSFEFHLVFLFFACLSFYHRQVI